MKASPSHDLRKDPRPQLHSVVMTPPRAGQRTSMADVAAAALLAFGAVFERRRPSGEPAYRAWFYAVPIVVVNYVAFRAQLRFWDAHLDRSDALLVSVALESIAIYWASLAHQAIVKDDSALRLKLAAYGTALIIGTLNYSHWMRPGWRPTVAAVTFGMMSVISPWLWSAYSRRTSRDLLKVMHLIEDHAVRLGLTRWFWHAWKCVRVMHKATWTGENRPAEAIKLIDKPAQIRSRKADKAIEPPAGTQTPPPVTARREPRGDNSPTSRAKAPGKGLAAARNETETEMIRELTESGGPLPAARSLAEDARLTGSLSTRRRAAARVLTGAMAGLNGSGHERDGS